MGRKKNADGGGFGFEWEGMGRNLLERIFPGGCCQWKLLRGELINIFVPAVEKRLVREIGGFRGCIRTLSPRKIGKQYLKKFQGEGTKRV